MSSPSDEWLLPRGCCCVAFVRELGAIRIACRMLLVDSCSLPVASTARYGCRRHCSVVTNATCGFTTTSGLHVCVFALSPRSGRVVESPPPSPERPYKDGASKNRIVVIRCVKDRFGELTFFKTIVVAIERKACAPIS